MGTSTQSRSAHPPTRGGQKQSKHLNTIRKEEEEEGKNFSGMAMAATPTRDLDDQDEGPPSYLFHVNSVDLTRRRNKLGLGTYTTTAVEEEDDAESGSVRFSGDPVEVIQVSLPFELEGGERNISAAAAAAGTKQGGDMNETTAAAEV